MTGIQACRRGRCERATQLHPYGILRILRLSPVVVCRICRLYHVVRSRRGSHHIQALLHNARQHSVLGSCA